MRRARQLVAVGCVLLSACNSAERDIRKAIIASLKDPESAKIGAIYLGRNGATACATVNAKNSMGGYTGAHEMTFYKPNKVSEWQMLGEGEMSHQECIAADEKLADLTSAH